MRGFEVAGVWIRAVSHIAFERTLVAQIYLAVSINPTPMSIREHTTIKIFTEATLAREAPGLVS